MKGSTFDIYSGAPEDEDAVWVEAVEGLSNARERMGELAKQNPGRYFLFSLGSQSVIAQIYTIKKTGSQTTKSQCA